MNCGWSARWQSAAATEPNMCNHYAFHNKVTRTVTHERRQPALSVSQARNRCFLWNTRDALVVSCTVMYTRQFNYFPRATCASRVVAKPKLKSPQMLTKSPAFYGTLRFTAVFTAARPFSQIHSVHTLHYFSNSLTLSTPMPPLYPSRRQVLHPNPVLSPALVPLAVPNSSPFISPHSLHSFSSAVTFST